jgi:hypothetical protein
MLSNACEKEKEGKARTLRNAMPKRRIQRIARAPPRHARRVRITGGILERVRRPELELRVERGEGGDVAAPGVCVHNFECLRVLVINDEDDDDE